MAATFERVSVAATRDAQVASARQPQGDQHEKARARCDIRSCRVCRRQHDGTRDGSPNRAEADRFPKTITLIEHLTGNTFVDLPPAGPTIGDELVFDSPLFDETDTKQIARGYGRCTRVGASETLHECTAFLDIEGAGGLIALQCSADPATPDTFCAVTGGTGRFARARGEMIGTNGPDDTVRFTLRLTT